ncbi:bifunctional (p)ppGpp synthetase/guanosine-3',5'-bis(diphosphate) 3'-pyrophosphohydrolase [candidate division TA06 bacterium]|uniref:Bifunctional (P)ppGpp synthetase/guanosine-3',5'-bis(Diphosphate) 3'-pyrophosphohydrolase n=1 Tax=candidate division TA06 bacterium TaxID=2250710 RepID=A0A523UNP4_UNCT6|nr:MAG: bifunctional (p)ppGpp synthetase/guanosine-3',5'-bis(diphosphate) 3'-pyrophosphohydrolase [candidate division TA06 bacterium]
MPNQKNHSEILFDAIEFAVKAHRGQFRKGTRVPYIVHPIRVAAVLIRHRCPQRVVVAGILHDVVEDTGRTLEDIEPCFGKRVARIVEAVSQRDKSRPWRKRKEETLERIKDAPSEVLLVECADKLDNIRTIREDCDRMGEDIWERFDAPEESQRWYYRSLVEAFRSRAEGGILTFLVKDFESEVRKVFGDDDAPE